MPGEEPHRREKRISHGKEITVREQTDIVILRVSTTSHSPAITEGCTDDRNVLPRGLDTLDQFPAPRKRRRGFCKARNDGSYPICCVVSTFVNIHHPIKGCNHTLGFEQARQGTCGDVCPVSEDS